MKHKSSDNPSQARLMTLLKFDESDLTANRQGQLSEEQRTLIRQEQQGRALAWAFAASIPMGVFLARPAGIDGSVLWVFVIVALVCLVGSLIHLYLMRTLLSQTQVFVVEGALSYVDFNPSGRRSPPPTIEIDGNEFNVPHPVQQAFIQGQIYRLYYLANPERLLSAELIE